MSNSKLYEINWTELADTSYNQELEFIYKKWNTKEVLKFMDLVDHCIINLRSGMVAGKNSQKTGFKSLVISKQTTLFYELLEDNYQINLLLFWNNKSDPKNLEQLLNIDK
ncbi:hypothetical protein [Psychroflexus aestuariivivens]|uniref:hypothetical protein n=1 Tax=Psychroflexus aestuariivivens TaxID=1795040 RepID=UPI000FD77DD9|nr:hypothetical protein [Psychroflexus aestuariivivens]